MPEADRSFDPRHKLFVNRHQWRTCGLGWDLCDLIDDRLCDLFGDRLCDHNGDRLFDLLGDRLWILIGDRLCDLIGDRLCDLIGDRLCDLIGDRLMLTRAREALRKLSSIGAATDAFKVASPTVANGGLDANALGPPRPSWRQSWRPSMRPLRRPSLRPWRPSMEPHWRPSMRPHWRPSHAHKIARGAAEAFKHWHRHGCIRGRLADRRQWRTLTSMVWDLGDLLGDSHSDRLGDRRWPRHESSAVTDAVTMLLTPRKAGAGVNGGGGSSSYHGGLLLSFAGKAGAGVNGGGGSSSYHGGLRLSLKGGRGRESTVAAGAQAATGDSSFLLQKRRKRESTVAAGAQAITGGLRLSWSGERETTALVTTREVNGVDRSWTALAGSNGAAGSGRHHFTPFLSSLLPVPRVRLRDQVTSTGISFNSSTTLD
ncbi:unnamed protein product [Closterium sp. Yama58-4]|nr:unnamed protein product [Closterium sp. Yama58-4]